MAENIGLDTLINFLAPLLLNTHEYTLQHLGPCAYLSCFSGYSLGYHGNYITQTHEWNMKLVIDPCEVSISVDIFENHFWVHFGLCHGSTHEYMKNNGTNGKPTTENMGLDTSISFLVPLLLKKHEYTI